MTAFTTLQHLAPPRPTTAFMKRCGNPHHAGSRVDARLFSPFTPSRKTSGIAHPPYVRGANSCPTAIRPRPNARGRIITSDQSRGGCGSAFLFDIYVILYAFQKAEASTASTRSRAAGRTDGASRPYREPPMIGALSPLAIWRAHRLTASPVAGPSAGAAD